MQFHWRQIRHIGHAAFVGRQMHFIARLFQLFGQRAGGEHVAARATGGEQDFIPASHRRTPFASGKALAGKARMLRCTVPRRRISPTNMPIVMAEASKDEPP